MPPKKTDTAVILAAIETSHAAQRVISDSVSHQLAEHTKFDDDRFRQLTVLVTGVAADVKSLLETRSFTRGVVKTAAVVSALVSAVVGFIFTLLNYLKGHP
jgi:hypothetical protein